VAYGMNLPALRKIPRPPAFPTIVKLLSKNLLFWSGKRTTFFGLRRTSKNFIPDLDLLLEWLRSGKISVPIKATFKLEEIQKAHREYASSARMGSIVIEISR
jgi:synaptic vesicle membrane protein VAT-1